jgi:RimJ/RimL family protein N-acetyltransferase
MRAWLYFEEEWSSALLPMPVPEAVSLVAVPAAQGEAEKVSALQQALSAHGIPAAEALLIAATDAGVRAARRLGIAVCAYANPQFPGQIFSDVRMVVEGFEEVDADFLERVYQREHGIPWVIARTDRCVIREFCMEDMPALIDLYDQPGITCQNQGFIEPLFPPETERDYEEAYIAGMYGYYGYGMWLVTEKASGAVIGRAGLEHRDFGTGTELELGYLIAPKWQHQGIATEVCRAILAFARENLDFPCINAQTDAKNSASIALLHRLGFSYLEDTDVSGRVLQRYRYPFDYCISYKNKI